MADFCDPSLKLSTIGGDGFWVSGHARGGSIGFQKKCLGKMKDVATCGRTVLFVSHQMAMISNLSHRCILMNSGRLSTAGPTGEVVQAYLAESRSFLRESLLNRKDRAGNGVLRFDSIWLEDKHGQRISTTATGQTVKICAHYKSKNKEPLKNVLFAFAIYNNAGVCITELCNAYAENVFPIVEGPEGIVECALPKIPLNRGRYSLNIIASNNKETFDYISDAAEINVESGDFFGTGRIASDDRRMVMFEQSWQQKAVR